jgi:LAO/AO transport system kinase
MNLQDLLSGKSRPLAQAITLVESHDPGATRLLAELYPQTGRARIIGVTGSPGAGKSTLVAAMARHYRAQDKRVGIIAVDPTSPFTGGAILGDRIRMADLYTDRGVFIRSMATRGFLGGLAKATNDVVDILDAAGFDVVLVETVGVGQSEVAVAGMVDCFILVIPPGGGDELQGIKRGIVELADLVVVNKADGDLAASAAATASDYAAALHLVRARSDAWTPRVVTCSALEQHGIDDVWAAVEDFSRATAGAQQEARRREQARAWMRDELADSVLERLHADAATAAAADDLEADVAAGRLAPTTAARRLLDVFFNRR